MCELKQQILVSNDTIVDSIKKTSTNDIISEMYDNLSMEYLHNDFLYRKFNGQASRIKNCYKFWNINSYELQKVKDIKNICLCENKFCRNCQNQISKLRYSVYTPLIEEQAKENDIYHVVFTIKNPKQYELSNSLDLIYKKFVYLIEYLKGLRKIKGIDFSVLGYKGCIRSLEITTKKKNGVIEYHPHFHCVFVLKKGLSLNGKNENEFSYSKANGFRTFTDLEILLQKIWFLLCNNEKVTKKNIDKLALGYSVILDKCETAKDYKEIFKYTLKEDFGTFINNYEIFKELVFALNRRRVICCYGCFYDISDKELEKLIDKETLNLYYETLIKLGQVEEYTNEYLDITDIKTLAKSKQVKFISKNSIKKYISEMEEIK